MNNETMHTIKIEVTKRGLPALWECGGGLTSRGNATIICRGDGRPKTYTYAPRGGHLACGQHALFIVTPGDVVVEVSVHGGELDSATIAKLRSFDLETKTALAEVINSFSEGEWDEDLGCYEAAVKAALSKARTYHCRCVFYGNSKEGR